MRFRLFTLLFLLTLASLSLGQRVASLTISPNPVTAGCSATATLTLDGTLSHPYSVGITSSYLIGVPTFASFSPGSRTTHVQVTTTAIGGNYLGAVYCNGLKTVFNVVQEKISAVTFSPSTVIAGGSTNVTVTLATAPTSDFPVSLSATQNLVGVPSQIVVPAGTTSATFSATTISSNYNYSAKIYATCSDSQMQSTLSVAPPSQSPWSNPFGSSMQLCLAKGSGATGSILTTVSTGDTFTGSSTPVIDGLGNIIVNGLSTVYSYDPLGNLNWSQNLGVTFWCGAAIDFQNNIVVVSPYGDVYSLNPLTGAQNWTTNIGDAVWCSPVIDIKGNIALNSYDNGLYVLSASTGQELMHYQTIGTNFAAVSVDKSGNYIFNDYMGNLYSVSPSGVLNWTRSFGDLGADLGQSVDGHGNIYLSEGSGYLTKLSGVDGSTVWTTFLGNDLQFLQTTAYGYFNGIAANDGNGNVYVVGQQHFWSINAPTGAIEWSTPISGISSLSGAKFVGSPIVDSTQTVYLNVSNGSSSQVISVPINKINGLSNGTGFTLSLNLLAFGNLAMDAQGNLYMADVNGHIAYIH